MKKIKRLLSNLEGQLESNHDQIINLNQTVSKMIWGGKVEPTNNGTCSGSNSTCINGICWGSNDSCNDSMCNIK
jgi:hypothetical protein